MRHSRLYAAALFFISAGFVEQAFAGPCSDGIADVGRKLSTKAAMGPATGGTISGTNPETAVTPATPGTAGTSGDAKLGGTTGTKEMSAAAGQVATSPADVRRQQEGLPLAATATGGQQTVETGPGANKLGMLDTSWAKAKTELQKARDLDAKDDPSCKEPLDRVRALLDHG